jgi:hypothetical protein
MKGNGVSRYHLTLAVAVSGAGKRVNPMRCGLTRSRAKDANF